MSGSGSGDAWRIAGEDRAKHDAQFFQLKPVNGFISGEQAKGFFLQSGLNTQQLGQIWTLADMNNDGKMDKKEFSIAMHLIKKKLQGYELPKTLPASVKIDPSPVIGSFGMQPMGMPMGGMGGQRPMAVGMGIPGAQPMAMRAPVASLGSGTMTTGSVGMPIMANGVPPMGGQPGFVGMGMAAAPQGMKPGGAVNWSMPHQSKLKYTQLFNTHDRNKRGFLTGVEARSILLQSNLPQAMLAQIWSLSDVDNDGKLTSDEFCIAMHLSDIVRSGQPLPSKLPAELLPPGTKGRAGSINTAAVPGVQPPQAGGQKDVFGDLLGSAGMAPPQPIPAALPPQAANGETQQQEEFSASPVTFEDKRKLNFDKGQAELEKRRAMLQEQLKQEEAARLEKERQEREKRERIRQEQERKKQQELERQMEKQRQIEREREGQRQKMLEQREAARREMDRQRQMDWERQRKEQLLAEKSREYELLSTLKAQDSNLKCELESLDGKKTEMAQKISQVRNGATDFSSSIENMRVGRDQTLADIDRYQKEVMELSQMLSRLQQEKEQVNIQVQTIHTTPMSDTYRTVMHSVEAKKTNVQRLRKELEGLERETATKLTEIDASNANIKRSSGEVSKLQAEIQAIQQQQQKKQEKDNQDQQRKDKERQDKLKKELEAQRIREQASSKSGTDSAWADFGSSATKTTTVADSSWGKTFSEAESKQATQVGWASDPFSSQSLVGKKKYKALFAFEARSTDELTLNVGDTVYISDNMEKPVEGMEEWYKGDVGTQCGWFPKAYVELCEDQSSQSAPAQKNTFNAFPEKTDAGDAPGLLPTSTDSPFSAVSPTLGQGQEAPDGLLAKATYPWKARQDNHLTFNKDDVITVKEQQDMWWLGELNGQTGWFPKAYVKLISAAGSAASASKNSSSTPSPFPTLERNGNDSSSPAPEKKEGEYYVAMFSYAPEQDSDLQFNEGDMVLVTNTEGDWWTGTQGDKTGTFPANYVKKVEIQPDVPASSIDAHTDLFGGQSLVSTASSSGLFGSGLEWGSGPNANKLDPLAGSTTPDAPSPIAEPGKSSGPESITSLDPFSSLDWGAVSSPAITPSASPSLGEMTWGGNSSSATIASAGTDIKASSVSPAFDSLDSRMLQGEDVRPASAVSSLDMLADLEMLSPLPSPSPSPAFTKAGFSQDLSFNSGAVQYPLIASNSPTTSKTPSLDLTSMEAEVRPPAPPPPADGPVEGAGVTGETTLGSVPVVAAPPAITITDDTGGTVAEFPEPTNKLKSAPGAKIIKKPEIAIVIAPYSATGTGQLSLEQGNIIHVRQKSPRGWWEGELQARGQKKKIGWFPANYVKLLGSSSSARSTPTADKPVMSVTPTPQLTVQAAAAAGSRSNTPQSTSSQSSQPSGGPPLEQVQALYQYTAQNEDELTFQKDAVITVLNKDNPNWWQGELDGKTGVFPANYVTPHTSSEEKHRQNYINELISTEETYMADMSIVAEAFKKPLQESGVLTEDELHLIFVNWNDLIISNMKMLKGLRVRRKMSGKGKPIQIIGDILCENLPHMTPYVRFCSCQLSAAALIQRKTEQSPEFVECHKKCLHDPRTKNMPLSSFLLKPMQRITKYPLMIKEMLKYTPPEHPDHQNLVDALAKAEEVCSQVNEGVREKENSDKLEWLQNHVHCDGLSEKINFNGVTNCLGRRKLLHSGVLYKAKSNKELLCFLFNDFLLMTIPSRPLGTNTSLRYICDPKSTLTFKMYKTPVVLNEAILIKLTEADCDPCQFQIRYDFDRVLNIKAVSETEKDLWIREIETASRQYLETEKKKKDRQHSMRKTPGVGRLLVVIQEAINLKASDNNGKSDPYCEVSMGSQEHRTKVMQSTLNPKWNHSMQFTIKDVEQDVLCLSVFDRDIFSPNDFLGRTEIRVKEVMQESAHRKGPITKKLPLYEVDSGEVIVKLDLQLYH